MEPAPKQSAIEQGGVIHCPTAPSGGGFAKTALASTILLGPTRLSRNGTTMRDRREEATGTQHIHPITWFPSIIVIGGQSIILTTLTHVAAAPPRQAVIAVRQ